MPPACGSIRPITVAASEIEPPSVIPADAVVTIVGDSTAEPAPTKFWQKIGWLDVLIVLVWLKATELLWIYAIENI